MSDVTITNVGEIKEKSQKSLKWSFLGELFAKLAAPLSTMILARLLAPEIYGIATAVTIVVSFCETVAESGFAKFLIQASFKDKEEFDKHISVALIVSLLLSIIGVAVIFFARYPLSSIVGNSGYEMVLVVSAFQIPFAATNAIFAAILRRDFNFRFLFFVRIFSCLPPFLVSIPLALMHFGHWSLVIGSIAVIVIQTPILIFACRKHLKIYFSFAVLKRMFMFSFAMIIESIIIWFCAWSSTFLAANFFNSTAVGLIKVGNTTVNSIFNLFSIPFISVLFPTLSRLKDNDKEFEDAFHRIQSVATAIIVPLGIGGYFYSTAICSILLGPEWGEASNVIALLTVNIAIATSTSYFLSEVFRSKGHFVSSIIYQVIMLVLSIGLHLLMGRNSIDLFLTAGLLTTVIMFVLAIFILKFKYKFSVRKIAADYGVALFCSAFMIPLIFVSRANETNNIRTLCRIVICGIAYISIFAWLFKDRFATLTEFVLTKRKK